MAITVVIRSGRPPAEGAPLSLTLDAPRIVIGRAESCEVRLPDPSVSVRHASLRQRGGSYLLVDESSTNGTFLGGVRLSPHAPRVVSDGDLVRVGRVWLELRLDARTPPSPPNATKELALALVQRALSDLGEPTDARVLIVEGVDAGRELSLERAGAPLVIGRGHDADLAIDEPDASRKHAQLIRRGEVLLVRDLGSKNGSFLANARLEAGRDTVWRVGEKLRIGKDIFLYDNPAAVALAELERGADEPIHDAEVIAPPVGIASPNDVRAPSAPPEAPAAEPVHAPEAGGDAPLVASPTADDTSRPTTKPRSKSTWGLGDVLIVVISLAVFALSLAGLWLLLHGLPPGCAFLGRPYLPSCRAFPPFAASPPPGSLTLPAPGWHAPVEMRENQQRYRVIDRLAAGGMAEVYRAESAGLEGFKKKVAIKRVLPHLAEKKKFISMFLDEARVSAFLSHSNCVQVFDIGVGDNTYFIVMEYVDGADLKAIIEWTRKAGRPITPAQAAFISTQICEGLSYAHELADEAGKPLGIIHRDMSPPNVLITKYGEVKIVDFGLAKASTQLEKSEPGVIKGKFSYLSPEAALGREVDVRTDLFAVGIILWEMLAGRKLFQGETDFDTVKRVQRADVPAISRINPKVDPALEAIITKALARDPDARYQSARDLGRALTRWLFDTTATISAFDLAELVQTVVRDKQKEKRETGVNIIDRLIEQTLFEFTSIERNGSKPGSAASPVRGPDLAGEMVDIQDWGSELSDLAGSPLSLKRNSLVDVAPNVRAGNLALLEGDDDDRHGARRSRPSSADLSAPSSRAQPPALRGATKAPPPLSANAPSATNPPAAQKKYAAVVPIVVAVLVAVGAAGAYIGGLFK